MAAASCATVQLASAAVASGAADAVLVYRAFNERSGRRFGQPIAENNQSRVTPPGWNWYLPFGLDTPAKVYSLWYQRYMHRYGVTNEDFGRYTVVARKHAATNPAAFYYQQPITLEDHQAVALDRRADPAQARLLPGERRRRRASWSPSWTGPATCRSRRCASRAAEPGPPARRRRDVRLLPRRPRRASRRRASMGRAALRGDRAHARRHRRGDDLRELHARSCSCSSRRSASAGPARPRDFIADGNIEVGGKLPVNTNGGLLGEAYIHGMNNILEGVRQVRGTAANQVDGAEHVLVSAGRSGLVLSP